MAKKKRRSKNKSKRKRQQPKSAPAAPPTLPPGLSWMDEEGLHALLPGERPPAEMMAVLNDNFQKELRNSPLWDEMVEKFGVEEAERLLRQVKVELRE